MANGDNILDSFERYFFNNIPKVKGYSFIDCNISKLGIYDVCPRISEIDNYIKSVNKVKGRKVFVKDEYSGIRNNELIPKGSIIFTSNEQYNNLECDVNYIPLLNRYNEQINNITIDNRKYLFSFVGKKTNPLRNEVLKLTHERAYISTEHLDIKDFNNLLSDSIFTLCPRGYNLSSYRICEALRNKSIPVYISDEFILPENFPEYGVIISKENINDIPSILANISIEQINKYIERGEYYYNSLFTYEGLLNWITQKLK